MLDVEAKRLDAFAYHVVTGRIRVWSTLCFRREACNLEGLVESALSPDSDWIADMSAGPSCATSRQRGGRSHPVRSKYENCQEGQEVIPLPRSLIAYVRYHLVGIALTAVPSRF